MPERVQSAAPDTQLLEERMQLSLNEKILVERRSVSRGEEQATRPQYRLDLSLRQSKQSDAKCSHAYSIKNIVGSTGGTYSQGPTPALNYNTYSITITAPATPGVVYTSSTDQTVNCVVVGVVFSGPNNPYIEIAFTRLINMGGPWTNCTVGKVTTVCDIPVKSWCGMSTTPPDYNPTKVRAMTFPIGPASFWDAYALCIRPLGFGP